mmetsp:Transcript_10857/g.22971  ORF Transcript_10857/g.22971 Transcript_10857/m.22971 type:complete len:287 (+) Transcript_10857:263-1123(+)|eukprot:CAMPEP_0171344102 /NCGR_PEP_ID=MMETSP0878-20121228/18646_1 /TAXON_ID=67004 /ORGANISM="Thalassiosira weissflogii, Strain CCMP1336" /LENGTH=286 /DNA_ID=CAMNT_0011847211 /DNA_START=135 /DNA_END=995 /DNA_ORIENTATION=+
MLRRATARSKPTRTTTTITQAQAKQPSKPAPSLFHSVPSTTNSANINNGNCIPQDELIERVRLTVKNAHVFKLPPKPSTSGWRGADWRDKVWQGTLKVVERGEETAVLLVDPANDRNIFAVCPIRHNLDGKNKNNATANNGVDRCIDSSRYFVLRIQNAQGRHMFIGLAFNERNDAFDFNTALEDSRREKEAEMRAALGENNSNFNKVDYRMKEGEKIRVFIPKAPQGIEASWSEDAEDEEGNASSSGSSAAVRRREARKKQQNTSVCGGGLLLKPSSKDTPSKFS